MAPRKDEEDEDEDEDEDGDDDDDNDDDDDDDSVNRGKPITNLLFVDGLLPPISVGTGWSFILVLLTPLANRKEHCSVLLLY